MLGRDSAGEKWNEFKLICARVGVQCYACAQDVHKMDCGGKTVDASFGPQDRRCIIHVIIPLKATLRTSTDPSRHQSCS
jgi:hypothetical protein